MTNLLPVDLLKGKAVFITGGGSGVNLGIARSFARVGANLAICGRTAEKLEKAAEDLRALGAKVSTSVADVRDMAALEVAFAKSKEEIGPADVVVCGAAGNFVAPAEGISSNGFKSVMDIDLLGSFHSSKAGFEQLKETRGALLFVSAGQAYLPFAFQAHVGAAKAGVESLMKNLALEWGRFGIRSNSVVPGPVEDTEGLRRLSAAAAGAGGADAWTKMVPLGRYAKQEEIGNMAVVLCSPLGAYVTGATVVVDGGWGLGGSAMFNQATAAALSKA